MDCPAPVQKAIQRIQLNINRDADEKLVAAWLDWLVEHEQMGDIEKWQSPAKRQRNSADALQHCTGR